MRRFVAVIVLVLTMVGALASGLRADGACPMLAQGHALHQMAAAGDSHAHHGTAPAHPGPDSDICKHACQSTLLLPPAAASPLPLRVVTVPEPAEPGLPASLRPDLADRPPKALA